MKKILFSAILLCATQFGFAQTEFKNDMVKYIEVTNSLASFTELIDDKILPLISEDKRQDFKKDVESTIPGLKNSMAEMLMTKISHEELKQLLEFYQTPLGQKLANLSKESYKNSQEIGEKWGMELQAIMMKYMN